MYQEKREFLYTSISENELFRLENVSEVTVENTGDSVLFFLNEQLLPGQRKEIVKYFPVNVFFNIVFSSKTNPGALITYIQHPPTTRK